MISIVIVSDIRLYREGLEEILNREDLLQIAGMASNVTQAIVEIDKCSPDVILLDMTMLDSNKAIGHITSSHPHAKIIVIAVTDDEDTILVCAKAGIAGYVSRESSIKEMINTVYRVSEGELYCPRNIAASLFHKLKSFPLENEPVSEPLVSSSMDLNKVILTKREKQIASLLSGGLSNKEIARNLTIEVSTVKNHIHNILTKMGVSNRMQAVNRLQEQ